MTRKQEPRPPAHPKNNVMPTGWFQVAWSADLGPGEVQPLRYFGQDLVLYRGLETGNAVVMDAYCPHLGAHLGYQLDDMPGTTDFRDGGCRSRGVEGDNILCPWHKWSFNPRGENVEIPYSERRFRGKGPKAWQVRELNGTILVWHDLLGSAPDWEPPVLPECQESSDYYPIHPYSVKNYRNVRVRPQQMMENSADWPHLKYVHLHSGDIVVESVLAEGPLFTATVKTTFDTSHGEMPGTIRPSAYGVGLLSVRLSGINDIVQIANTTPVDETTADFFLALAVRRVPGEPEPGKLARAMVAAQQREAERDLRIWENARWVERPPFPREEAHGYRVLRTWAKQFYPTREEITGVGEVDDQIWAATGS